LRSVERRQQQDAALGEMPFLRIDIVGSAIFSADTKFQPES
jgi:hypothetical protein